MKKLLLAAILSIGMIGFAQNRPERQRLTPEQRNEKRLEKFTTELNLTPEQKKQVGDLLATESASMQKRQMEKRDRTSKLTPAEKEAYKNEMMAIKAENEAKLKSILTPEQYQKHLTMQQENLAKMKERGDKKRGNLGTEEKEE